MKIHVLPPTMDTLPDPLAFQSRPTDFFQTQTQPQTHLLLKTFFDSIGLTLGIHIKLKFIYKSLLSNSCGVRELCYQAPEHFLELI